MSAWEPTRRRVRLVERPALADAVKTAGCYWPDNVSWPTGKWLIFDHVDGEESPNTVATWFAEAAEGEPHARRQRPITRHRKFARLWREDDASIAKAARRLGPLGLSWRQFVDPEHSSHETRLVEPVALWRAESAVVSWLCLLLDLAHLSWGNLAERPKPGESFSDTALGLMMEADEAADSLSALQYIDVPPHIHRAAYQHPKFREALELRDMLSSEMDGTLQRNMKGAFTQEMHIAYQSLHRHLVAHLVWPTTYLRPTLGIASFTALGAMYAMLTLEALSQNRPVKRCQRCNKVIVGWKRSSRIYCSHACAQASSAEVRKAKITS